MRYENTVNSYAGGRICIQDPWAVSGFGGGFNSHAVGEEGS